MIRIHPISGNKKQYLDLLLLADEQESMIDRYLERGEMFILSDNDTVKASCVITCEDKGIYEIKSIAVYPEYQRQGYGRHLVLINQSIVSDEENWNMFQANFDRIHENFFRNLKQQYPDLTAGDLRFCALLRLNMPTKEIAKLLNISVRGVDAARYRLRKKFNLSQEDSLTDFMINFK